MPLIGLFSQKFCRFSKALRYFWGSVNLVDSAAVYFGARCRLYKQYPLTYDHQYWGMVFPLRMYTVGTIRLSQALELPFLMVIPPHFIYIALIAWLGTFIGLILHLAGLQPISASQP